MSEVVVAEELTKYYDGKLGIEDVSFTVRRGEVFCYLGPNGSGKTTTIRLMLGLIKPSRGRVLVMGVDSRDEIRMAHVKKSVGYLPEELGFPRGLRSGEILRYFKSMRGDAPRLDEVLELFPLDLEKRVEEYSRGMKQALAIALAFMHDPDLVILDEPTTGLDPLLRERFLAFVKREAERGKTVFLSSHVLSEVQKVASRVCLIKGGRIVAIEDLNSLLSKHGKILRARLKEPLRLSELESWDGVVKARVSNDGREIEAVVKSGYSRVLEMLARYHVEDIEIRSMTLEEFFLHFYER
ncbi:MAG: ABC transporter ATP-binding protein [Acidilobaceae archaeon]